MTTTEQIAADMAFASITSYAMTTIATAFRMGRQDTRTLGWQCGPAEAGLANPQELGTVMGWVLTAMRWTARLRPLTDDEVLIYSAALRVSDFLMMFDTLALLGQALEAKDWGEARRQWLHLAPCHASLIAAWPDAAYLNIILQDLTQTSIH